MKLFKQYLADHGLKDADMAKLIGVKRSHVAHMRVGRRRPSLDVALKIEKITDGAVPVDSWSDNSPCPCIRLHANSG